MDPRRCPFRTRRLVLVEFPRPSPGTSYPLARFLSKFQLRDRARARDSVGIPPRVVRSDGSRGVIRPSADRKTIQPRARERARSVMRGERGRADTGPIIMHFRAIMVI